MTLHVDIQGETQIIVTRHFRATPEKVYRAHTEADILKKWLLGPDGWSMPVCLSDPRPGGKIRYEWTKDGAGFALTGEYVALTPFSRLEHVERMHLPDVTPDNHVVTEFLPDGTGTRLVMTMSVPDSATQAAMLATGMTDGMEASYARLDAL
ncbi:MAG: SRPBCC domain-containing protein [Pseudorhodobacter sp.]|nr:SRPBCC domain-containing protein [Pseudorhodobacter sp.]